MLQREARRAAWLILWLDCDREGEAICQEARRRQRCLVSSPLPRSEGPESFLALRAGGMDVCAQANARLGVKRARFSALTHGEVWRAVGTHMGVPNAAAAAAVQLRQEIDLRLGAACTRCQTMALGQEGLDWGEFAKEDGKAPIISYGPCHLQCDLADAPSQIIGPSSCCYHALHSYI